MATIRWDGSTDNTWDDGTNWVGGVSPADGDDVQFLIGDLVGVRCAVGPAAAVTLISITDDAGYGAGATPTICYANITVTTVTILSDCYIAGGTVQTATLSGNGARITGGTLGTVTLNAGVASVQGGTIATLNLNGAADYADNAGLSVTTVNITGAGAYIDNGTYGTVNMNADTAELRSNATCTTVHVYGNACEVSGNAIAASQIANGPYAWYRDCLLTDNDTNELIMDATYTEPYAAGAW